MITGKIDVAKPSKSGKTLGVKIKGKWYSTSEWELENMVGETITITDTKSQDLPGGGSITYLNAYEVGSATAPDQPTQSDPSRTTAANPAENALLLDFVGRCMMGFPWQTSDLVVAKTRMRQCYELGQNILDGSIMAQETGPRRSGTRPPDSGGIPGYSPMRPESEPEDAPQQDEFDDDIPF